MEDQLVHLCFGMAAAAGGPAFCRMCGEALVTGARYCTCCGRPQAQDAPYHEKLDWVHLDEARGVIG